MPILACGSLVWESCFVAQFPHLIEMGVAQRQQRSRSLTAQLERRTVSGSGRRKCYCHPPPRLIAENHSHAKLGGKMANIDSPETVYAPLAHSKFSGVLKRA